MSVGKSSSKTRASKVWEAQTPYLMNLYDAAQTMQARAPGSTAMQTANRYQAAGNPMMEQLGAGGQSAQFMQSPHLQQMMSGQMQNQALGGAIQAGLGDITQNLQRNILPSVKGGAVAAGTSGGSRQGIAEGLAMSDANRQASDFVSRMMSDNFGQMMQQRLSALGMGAQAAGAADQATAAGLQGATQLANLGFTGEEVAMQSYLQPYQTYAGMIGAPTVLGQGSSSSGWNVGIPAQRS